MNWFSDNTALNRKTRHMMDRATDGEEATNRAVDWYIGRAKNDIRFTNTDKNGNYGGR